MPHNIISPHKPSPEPTGVFDFITQMDLLSLMENAPDGIFLMDASGVILAWNHAQEKITGLSHQQVIGKTLCEIQKWLASSVGPEDGSSQSRFLGSLDLRSFDRSGEARVISTLREPSGTPHTLESSVFSTSDQDTSLIGCISRDITAAHRQEVNLTRQTEEYAALFQTSLEINSENDIQKLLLAIMERATRLIQTRTGGLFLIDCDTQTLELKVSYNLPPEQVGIVLKFGEGVAGRVAISEKPLVIEDYEAWEGKAVAFTNTGIRRILGVPLKVREKMIGVITMTDPHPGSFSEHEIRLACLFADQAALAIDHMRRTSNIQQEADDTAALFRSLSPLLNPGSDTLTLAKQIVDIITSEFTHAHCAITFYDDQAREIYMVAQSGYINCTNMRLAVDGPGLTTYSFRTGESIYVPDVSKDPRFLPGPEGTRSEFVIPLKTSTRVLGVMNLESPELDDFDEHSRHIILQFADRATLALENAWLRSEEIKRTRELELLHTVTSSLVSTLEIQELMDRILSSSVNAIPAAKSGSISLLEPDNKDLVIKAVCGCQDPGILGTHLTAGHSGSYKAILDRQSMIIKDILADPTTQLVSGADEMVMIRSLIVAPLMIEDQVLGAISLDSNSADAFSDADLRLLTTIASTISLAIQNAQLHAKVRDLSIRDPLTDLLNRRGFFELGQHEMNRARRLGHPLSALMCDTDLLKKINDLYGHNAGDQALKLVAGCFQKNLRSIDIIGRYGGDEFSVLLPATHITAAVEIAERLRQDVENSRLEVNENTIHLTLTLGVAEISPTCQDIETLLNHADEALLRAKMQGRNRVFVY